jgi:hypothetical protein
MFPADTARIEVSALSNRAGVLGAVALALDQPASAVVSRG